ncbi:MAG TPA: hypothetical protein VK638_49420, partial [Edaphobacter sp.]|nr:hypothetical protein [Edaphobacter sp.]
PRFPRTAPSNSRDHHRLQSDNPILGMLARILDVHSNRRPQEALIPSNASGRKRPRCFSLAELAERPSMASQ